MRQVFLEKGAIVVKEISEPLLQENSVLVRVSYSFISSGTELATISGSGKSLLTNIPDKIKKVIEAVTVNGIDGTKALIKSQLMGPAQAIGYSCSGQIIAVGAQVKHFRVGDLVACAGAGYANHAEVVCVPENLVVRVSENQFLQAASLTTIGAIALQGIRRANVTLGEIVCVQGLGLLGQITVQLAKLSGATVIGLDLLDDRLQLAEQLGADYVYNASDPHLKKQMEFLTQHHGVDVTLITAASSSNQLVQQAMELTRKKGKVVVVGDVGLGLSRDPLYKNEIDFLISCSYGPGRYDPTYEERNVDYPYAYVRWTENRNMQAFVKLIEQHKIDVAPLISVSAPLEQADQAYKQLQEKKGLGVVICYDLTKSVHLTTPAKPLVTDGKFLPARRDQLRVGIVGAGGFAKVSLLPIINKIPNAKINAIVDTDLTNSLNVCKLYGAARALSNDVDLLHDDLADVVVIASPHKYHCEQALKALQCGKAVFLEKPMVTTQQQLGLLQDYLTENPQAPFCVDYNRSFAPFIKKIKQALVKRHSPIMVQYRMNSGYISKEHWIQSEVGAGRIIGEACHIFDLFCFLTDSKPVSVSVEALHAGTDDIFPTDNFSAQISFADGSVCTLMYTSLGHEQLSKERMEIFFDGKTIVMDDYAQLYGFGFSSLFNETTVIPDKGHKALLNTFFEHLKKPHFTPPIEFQRLFVAAQLTLTIDQLACQKGGSKELVF